MTIIQENLEINPTHSLDLLDLACPKPLLFTKKKLAELATGEILAVWVNQEKNIEDLQFFCQNAGHTLLKIENLKNLENMENMADVDEDAQVLYIQKK